MAKSTRTHEFRLLRIRLNDVEPVVQRRVIVDADLTLFDLYQVLVNTMGWNESHMHSFTVGDDTYSAPVPDIEPVGIDERTITVREALPNVGSEAGFQYDFGDGWEHEVTVIAAGALDQAIPSTVIDGSNACPPDDCGGPFGYTEILKALDDPSYKSEFMDVDDLQDWLPEYFDPNEFDRFAAQADVSLPPSLEGWNEMYAALPDVGKDWTKVEMDRQRKQFDEWQASMPGEFGPDNPSDESS